MREPTRTFDVVKPGAIVTVALLLVGPAVVVTFAPRAGFATAVAAVVILVYLVLRNEGRGGQDG